MSDLLFNENKYTLLNDIAYGSCERQTVDIFIPRNVKNKSGIILYVHGGGWTMGDKTIHHPDALHFCNLGYVAASMNYRYVNEEIDVSDELDDITSALKAIKSKLEEHGINTEKMIVSGGSAGGHLALMYAYTRKTEAPVTPVAACVYCPPVDLTSPDGLKGGSGELEDWKNGILSFCCGVEINKENFLNKTQQEALGKISPEIYVTPECVPTAVFQGKLDELVPFEQITKFIGVLNDAGVKNDLLIYENSGHAQDKDPEKVAESKEIIKKYAELYL